MTIWKTNIADDDLKIVSMDFRNSQDFGDLPAFHLAKREVIGIGFETKRDGTWLRAAVEMRVEPSLTEISEAVALLFKAYTEPENPEIKVVRGHVELTPNAMQTTALVKLNKAKSQ